MASQQRRRATLGRPTRRSKFPQGPHHMLLGLFLLILNAIPILSQDPVIRPALFLPSHLRPTNTLDQHRPQHQESQDAQLAAGSSSRLSFEIPKDFNFSQTVQDILSKLPPDLRLPGAFSTDRYIVALKPEASSKDLDNHINWLLDILTKNNIVDQQTAEKFAGILTKFDSEFIRGYECHIPKLVVDLLKGNSLVNIVEQDQYVGIVQQVDPPTANLSASFISAISGNDTQLQRNPPWGLDRISHREPGFLGVYPYPPNGGVGIDIYVVDTGCNTNHQDFGGRARFGASFSPNGNDDGNGHGTHVAGTAAGTIYGVAKGANIIAVKVLDNDGQALISQVIKGVEWVLQQIRARPTRRAVINMSLGGGGKSALLNNVISQAVQLDVPVAAAAGNNNTDACLTSPGDSEFVLTVGASDENDRRATFSNWGRCVKIMAPGTNITSTWITSNTATRIAQGTSMASPHVAGLMALVLSTYPNATASDVYNILLDVASTDVLDKSTLQGGADRLLYNGLNATRFESLGSNFKWSGKWELMLETFKSIWI
ncbi:peptidase S8/S53 domain-containing protein [Phlyctochytrium arcticum]|nr:peptidase S8/S53 domain-containing protein [Phlyctochytrium arcticum]